jgi:hypothetical protein
MLVGRLSVRAQCACSSNRVAVLVHLLQIQKQPLLPPLLPVVQPNRGSHSRSSSRTQAELKSGGSVPVLSSPVIASDEQHGATGGSVRQPRPRSIAVMAAPPPDGVYDGHRWVAVALFMSGQPGVLPPAAAGSCV